MQIPKNLINLIKETQFISQILVQNQILIYMTHLNNYLFNHNK
jgi:hypothetical protein